MLSDPARERLAQAVATDPKIFLAAMRLAAGEMEAKQEAPADTAQNYNFTTIQMLMKMSPESQLRFIETGDWPMSTHPTTTAAPAKPASTAEPDRISLDDVRETFSGTEKP